MNRGGSWNNNPRNCRSANRNRNAPGNRNSNLGFRLLSSAVVRKQMLPTEPTAIPFFCLREDKLHRYLPGVSNKCESSRQVFIRSPHVYSYFHLFCHFHH